jgi:sigma-B regulation protein RsbU (phosphoserine phosphatase)
MLNPRILRGSHALSRAAAGLAILVGGAVLAGWVFDVPALRTILPGQAAMSPSTAIAAILTGVPLWLLQQGRPAQGRLLVARTCALAVAAIGLFTSVGYFFGWSLSLDQLFFANQGLDHEMLVPSRMAPGAAVNFVLLGAALLLLGARLGYWVIQALAIAAGLLPVLACLGYLYGAELLYGVVCIGSDCAIYGGLSQYTALALITAITLGLLALALLAARPSQGLMEIISSDSAGGLLARRVLPAAVVIPIAAGWLALSLERDLVIDTHLGAALVAGLNIIAVGGLLWWSARSLFRVDQQRRLSERELAGAREREAEIGFRIQRTLLFQSPPRDLPWARIAALTIPSERIDGDFFDFLVHTDRCLDVILGDVMGKGVPAALLGAATKTRFLGALSHLITTSKDRSVLPEPKEIVTLAHALVGKELVEVESFVTICYARFDLKQGCLSLVDCGHTRTIHFRRTTGSCEFISGDNLPFGFSEEEIFDQVVVQIAPGDVLFFYSDGLTEARSPQGEFFGVDRLVDLVQTHAGLDPEDLVDRVRSAAESFRRSTSFGDDLTCVAVKLLEPDIEAPLTRARIEISSDLKELARTRAFVRGVCTEAVGVLDEGAVDALVRAITEAASNIMIHAYDRRPDQPIELRVEVFADRVVVELHHLGMSFDPNRVAIPRLDGTQTSGFGMYIMAQSVEEVKYYRDERGWNCIKIVKMSK